MKTFFLTLMLITVMFATGYTQSPESHAYWRTHAAILEKQVRHLPKGIPVQITLRDRTIIFGRYDGYTPYDQTLWVDIGHWFDTGYSLREVLDIRAAEKI